MDGRDQVGADLAGQHHLHDLHRLVVRDPEAVLELGLEPETLAHGRDLGTAAVDQDRLHADVAEEDHVEQGLVARVVDRVAADLDHDHLAVEALDVRKRLDQDLGSFLDAQCHVV